MILGIDEAGRGPVIGPLVMCGVWVTRSRQHKLTEIGVRDSKSFGSSERARQRRKQIANHIRTLASSVVLICVDANAVDRRVRLGELNLLEQELAETIITAGPPARQIIADGARLFSPLKAAHSHLRAIDKADISAPAVAAASIFAKVERDQRVEEIMAQFETDFGPIQGGGYVNKNTEQFLRAYFERHRQLPPGVRKSWDWSVLRDLDRLQAGVRPIRKSQQLELLNINLFEASK